MLDEGNAPRLASELHLLVPNGPKDNAIKVKDLIRPKVMCLTDQGCPIFLCLPFSVNNFPPASLMAGNKTVIGYWDVVRRQLCLIH